MISALGATNIIGRQSLKFAQALSRASDGDVLVQPGLKDAITRRNQMFLPYLKSTDLKLDTAGVATFVSDVKPFCKLWCDEQSVSAADVKIIRGSADGGGNSIKISFSFLTCDDAEVAVAETGVRRICMFVLATGVKESYDSMKSLLQLIDTRALKSFFRSATLIWAQDTKMNWIVSGKTHGGTFPCVGCLRHHKEAFSDDHQLRTFGETAADARRYAEHVQGKSANYQTSVYSKFNNCVRPTLIDTDSDGIVLETLTPNPLHMKLRIVNKLHTDFEKSYPDVAIEFIKRLRLTKERYHDEFEGRPCSKIARSHAVLRSVLQQQRSVYVTRAGVEKKRRLSSRITEQVANTAHHPAIHVADALEAMDGVMKFMYGRQIDEEYRHCVDDFKDAIGKIGSSVTVSMHMLLDHSPRFCAEHNTGLLAYSEEAAESLHSECKLCKKLPKHVHGPSLTRTVINILSAKKDTAPPHKMYFYNYRSILWNAIPHLHKHNKR